MTLAQELLGTQPLALWLGLGLVGFVLTWRGANVVERSTSKISDHFGVSQAIQGGLIAAVATSFPELAITVISVVVLGEFGVGAGALIGTAIFNILVIPGVVTVMTGDAKLTRGLVYRDAIFYLVAVLAFFGVIALGVIGTEGQEVTEISPAMAIGLLVLYVVYVVLLVNGQRAENGNPQQRTALPKQAGLFAGGLAVVLVGVELMIGMTLELSTAIGAPPFLMSRRQRATSSGCERLRDEHVQSCRCVADRCASRRRCLTRVSDRSPAVVVPVLHDTRCCRVGGN